MIKPEELKEILEKFAKGDLQATTALQNFLIHWIRKRKALSSSENNEDLAQEVLMKIYNSLQGKTEVKHPIAWINTIINNSITDNIRKEINKKHINYNDDIEKIIYDNEAIQPKKSLEKKELNKPAIITKLKRLKPDFLERIELSLDYVAMIYKLRDKVVANKSTIFPMINDRRILRNVINKVENSKVNLTEKTRFLNILRDLNEQIDELNTQIFNAIYIKGITFPPRALGLVTSELICDFHRIRLDPSKLIYKVWHKFCRKKQYSSLKLIQAILPEYKKSTLGTEKEFLFDSLKKPINLNTLRKKSLYQKSKSNDLYEKITDYIYDWVMRETSKEFKSAKREVEEILMSKEA